MRSNEQLEDRINYLENNIDILVRQLNEKQYVIDGLKEDIEELKEQLQKCMKHYV